MISNQTTHDLEANKTEIGCSTCQPYHASGCALGDRMATMLFEHVFIMPQITFFRCPNHIEINFILCLFRAQIGFLGRPHHVRNVFFLSIFEPWFHLFVGSEFNVFNAQIHFFGAQITSNWNIWLHRRIFPLQLI